MASKKIKDIPLDDISILREGLNGRFWAILKKIMQENIDEMTAVINNDIIDPLLGKLTPQVREEYVKWRLMNKALLELPESLISSMEQGQTEPVRLDPYAKNFDELVKMNHGTLT